MCAVVAKFDKRSAPSVTKILGVQHIGGKVTGWMYGRADYFFAQPTGKLGGQQPITHPLFMFCANNTSHFVFQISLSNSNFGTGPSISNITQYLIFTKPDLSRKKIQRNGKKFHLPAPYSLTNTINAGLFKVWDYGDDDLSHQYLPNFKQL